MAKEPLIIFDKFDLPDGSIVIGLNTENQELHDQWRTLLPSDLTALFEGKSLFVKGTQKEFHTQVLAVEVLTSLADFKNVFLKLPGTVENGGINLGDEVEIELSGRLF